jgi:hypothetical protein
MGVARNGAGAYTAEASLGRGFQGTGDREGKPGQGIIPCQGSPKPESALKQDQPELGLWTHAIYMGLEEGMPGLHNLVRRLARQYALQ